MHLYQKTPCHWTPDCLLKLHPFLPYSFLTSIQLATEVHMKYNTKCLHWGTLAGVHLVKLNQASPMICKNPRKDVLYFVLKLFLHCCIHFGKQCLCYIIYPKIFMQHIFLNYLIFTNTSGFKWCSLYKYMYIAGKNPKISPLASQVSIHS